MLSHPKPNERDASVLVRQLQSREISAEDLVRSCLARIEEREETVNAWAHLDAAGALAQAREIDRGAIRGLLHGVPVGIKDLFDTAEMPTAYGSPIYAAHRPAADASAVAACRASGAIVLGKTVSTEFATFHPGPTSNPRNQLRTPGGSSSGSAAAVADHMVPLAVGTQTAGSIIRPAAFCGVVGYKPSYGSIARAGVKSLAESLDTVGVFGRTVADAALFAAVLAGDARMMLQDLAPDPQALRIGVCHTFEWPHADDDTTVALQRGAARLSRDRAAVSDCVLPPALSSIMLHQMTIMAFEAARNLAHERLGHPDRLSASLAALLRAGLAVSAEQYHASLAAAAQGRAEIAATFADFDVLIAPSAVGVAPLGLAGTGDPVFCRMWTLLGLPCIHLPFASGMDDMPLGLQVVGRFQDDARMLAIARWMHAVLLDQD